MAYGKNGSTSITGIIMLNSALPDRAIFLSITWPYLRPVNLQSRISLNLAENVINLIKTSRKLKIKKTLYLLPTPHLSHTGS